MTPVSLVSELVVLGTVLVEPDAQRRARLAERLRRRFIAGDFATAQGRLIFDAIAAGALDVPGREVDVVRSVARAHYEGFIAVAGDVVDEACKLAIAHADHVPGHARAVEAAARARAALLDWAACKGVA
jgi:hypothetical protein